MVGVDDVVVLVWFNRGGNSENNRLRAVVPRFAETPRLLDSQLQTGACIETDVYKRLIEFDCRKRESTRQTAFLNEHFEDRERACGRTVDSCDTLRVPPSAV